MKNSVNRDGRLTGPRLLVARLTWLVLVTLIVGPYLVGVFTHAGQLQEVCLRPAEVCHQSPVQFTAEDMATMAENGFSPRGYATLQTVKLLFFFGIWFAVGGLIFMRKSDEPMALLVSFFLVTWGTGSDGIASIFAQLYPLWEFPAQILKYLANLSLILFLALFPNGRFAPRWIRWVVLVSAIPYSLFIAPDSPLYNSPTSLLMQLGLIGSLLFAQLYRYKYVSTPSERLQTRWVVLGISMGFGVVAGLVLLFLMGLLTTEPYQPTWASFAGEMLYQIAIVLIPISVGVAILRYRLFEIDVIIRKTLAYGTLTAVLVSAYFGTVIVLQTLVGSLTGEQSPLVIVISTLVIAALFTPVRGRVQKVIDRRFFRQKYDAEQVLERFAQTARDEVELAALTAEMARIVDETVRPDSVGVWLKPAAHRAAAAAWRQEQK